MFSLAEVTSYILLQSVKGHISHKLSLQCGIVKVGFQLKFKKVSAVDVCAILVGQTAV